MKEFNCLHLTSQYIIFCCKSSQLTSQLDFSYTLVNFIFFQPVLFQSFPKREPLYSLVISYYQLQVVPSSLMLLMNSLFSYQTCNPVYSLSPVVLETLFLLFLGQWRVSIYHFRMQTINSYTLITLNMGNRHRPVRSAIRSSDAYGFVD